MKKTYMTPTLEWIAPAVGHKASVIATSNVPLGDPMNGFHADKPSGYYLDEAEAL